ncbi:MAG: alpha/beta hydrolase, partial [Bacteroidia bacterium]
GYLATYFINKFSSLDLNEHFLVVPEGLHRYYLNAVTGKVGASWMTKEDRENDIDDYCNYLDNVYETFILPLGYQVIVNALGFSQGGATISRWAAKTHHHIDTIIMWGSGIPPDMNWEKDLDTLRSFHWLYVAGNHDLYLSKEQRDEQLALLEKHGITPDIITYEGGHDIEPETLKLLTGKCVKVKR